MFRKLLLVLAILIVAFVGYVATRPAHYEVVRSATVDAPPQIVFAQVNDFGNWSDWSPWMDVDPDMEISLSGADSGVGAEYHWVGNAEAGEGHMEIIESRPYEHVGIDLDFIKPFAASSKIAFDLEAEGSGTRVSWGMSGDHDFAGKLFSLFMDMDASIGSDFDKGLSRIKEISEAEAAQMQMEGAVEEGEEGAGA